MSNIIEGSLEILRPIGAAVNEEELDDVSPPASAAQDDQNGHAFQQQHEDDNKEEEARTSHNHVHEEEENGGNDDSFAETEESFGSEHEEEDNSLIVAEGGRERAVKTPKRLGDEAKWQSELQLLRKYRKQHGHCRVPYYYKIDGVKLGSWLHKQRASYKKHCNGMPSWITQERIDQLEAIGVDWNPWVTQWQSKLELLRQYREWNGHCNKEMKLSGSQSWSFCDSIKSNTDTVDFRKAMQLME